MLELRRKGLLPLAALLAATWKTAFPAVESALPALLCGDYTAEDAAAFICRHVEIDPRDTTVGFWGMLNNQGIMELDAAFMEGGSLRSGAVIGLQDVEHPVDVARAVMERTPHRALAGAGADGFAASVGAPRRVMLSPEAKEAYERWKENPTPPTGKDTVCAIARDASGHFAIGASTSGLAWKMAGRVSDTALCGCGFYCDDRAGAAVATGLGEDIIRGCLSFGAVLLMEQGQSAYQACEAALLRLLRRVEIRSEIALLCVDLDGNIAGAANHGGFDYCAGDGGGCAILRAPVVSP